MLLGELEGFFGLRHEAVVGRHDEHGDVRDRGSALAHLGEGGVARSVEERDSLALILRLLALIRNGVGADVLGDAASFA